MNLRAWIYGLGAYARGGRWRAHLREIRESRPEDIGERSLVSLLDHALVHVHHYRDLAISDPRIDSFPLLTRAALRTQYEKLKSDDLDKRHWCKASTGGSTGEPVWVIRDRNSRDWDRTSEMYAALTFCGMSPLEYLSSPRVNVWHRRRLQLSPNPLLRLAVRALGRDIYLEPYEILTQQKLNEHIARINTHKPEIIVAYAGTMYEIAKHAARKGVRMHQPRFILTSVEMLFAAMRRVIQEVFDCPVYNRYGAAETGGIAAECPHGKLHVFSFSHHVEVLDSQGQPVKSGDVGRIVVTPLHNMAMPLIRYDIGDLARVSVAPCSCGNPLPAWDEILGRVVHHFVRPDGSAVRGGNFIAMFYEYDWVMRFHVLQEDFDKIVVSYKRVPGREAPSSDIEAMTKVIRDLMGGSCSVIWKEVDAIPNSPVGKHLHVRSLVWEERTGMLQVGEPREPD